jgi:hypothetical protein
MPFVIRDGKFLIGSDGAFSTNEDCCCGADPCNCASITAAVASITRSGTTATVTTAAPNLFFGAATTKLITIAGADQTEYNGARTATFVSDSSFTYAVSGTPATPATGTITATYNRTSCTHCDSGCTPVSYRVALADVSLCPNCTRFDETGFGKSDYFSVTAGDPTGVACAVQQTDCQWQRLNHAITGRAYSNSGCTTPTAAPVFYLLAFVTIDADEMELLVTMNNVNGSNAVVFYDRIAHTGCGTASFTNQVSGSCGDHHTADPGALVTYGSAFVFATGGTATVTPCCDDEEEDI